MCGIDAEAFVRMLARERADGADVVLLAKNLGFAPDDTFCVAAIAQPPTAVTPHIGPGVVVTAPHGDVTVVVTQGVDVRGVADTVGVKPGTAAGVGAARSGIDGARLSLRDAQQALALGRGRGECVLWEDCWPAAILTDHVDQLRDLLLTTSAFGADNQHLADAVRAFAAEFSSTRAARQLFVHPNTVLYRLRQWHKHTGWDPSSLSGLEASVLSLDLGPLLHGSGQRAEADESDGL